MYQCFEGVCSLHLQDRKKNCYKDAAVSINLSASPNFLSACKPVLQTKVRGPIPSRCKKCFSSPQCQKRLWGSPTCTLLDVFMVSRLIKHRGNFTVYLSCGTCPTYALSPIWYHRGVIFSHNLHNNALRLIRWPQAAQSSPLFHFAVNRGPRVWIQCTAVYSPHINTMLEMISFGMPSADTSHIYETSCSLHVGVV